jgi:hypothetical protein
MSEDEIFQDIVRILLLNHQQKLNKFLFKTTSVLQMVSILQMNQQIYQK